MDMLTAMKSIPRMPIDVHSYPHSLELVDDTQLHAEVIRVTGSLSLNVQFANDVYVEKMLNLNPDTIVFHISPYTHKWRAPGEEEKHDWKRSDWNLDNGAPVIEFLLWWVDRVGRLKNIVDRVNPLQKVLFYGDHERWPLVYGATRWLRYVALIAKNSFPEADWSWYNFGQEAHLSFPPIESILPSTHYGTSLYFGGNSRENNSRIKDTVDRNKDSDRKFMPCVSMFHYEDRSYNLLSKKKRSSDTIIPDDPGAMWALGSRLANNSAIDNVMLWPELFAPRFDFRFATNFYYFLRGMIRSSFDHEGRPEITSWS